MLRLPAAPRQPPATREHTLLAACMRAPVRAHLNPGWRGGQVSTLEGALARQPGQRGALQVGQSPSAPSHAPVKFGPAKDAAAWAMRGCHMQAVPLPPQHM